MNIATTGGGILAAIAAIWVLYEVWMVNRRLTNGYKVVWSLAALFFSIITAIIYYFVEKRRIA